VKRNWGSRLLTDAPNVISIDWKFPGRDYLGFFPEVHPDLAFLHGQDFSDLEDDLAFEMPETVFEALSAFFATHAYELWNLNRECDDYHLMLVPRGQGSDAHAMAAKLSEDEDEGFKWFAERLAPDATKGISKGKPRKKATPKAKKLPSIIEDSEHHLGYGDILYGSCHIMFMEFDDDGDGARPLVDTHKWPIEDVSSAGFRALDRKLKFWPIYGGDTVQFWVSNPTPKQHQIVAVRDYEITQLETWGGEPFSSEEAGSPCAGFGDTLFYCVSSPLETSVPVSKKRRWSSENPNQKLFMARNGQTSFLGEIVSAKALLPLSESRLAIISENRTLVDNEPPIFGTDLRIIDLGSQTSEPQLVSAEHNMTSAFVMSPDEIGFISIVERKHECRFVLIEKEAYLCRYHIPTGQIRKASLFGLHNRTRLDVPVPRPNKSDPYDMTSLQGDIVVGRGHEDWFILNYQSDVSGQSALAWLWNMANDEVVIIALTDFPREDPTIYYNKGLGRYQASQSRRIDLLVPFEEIYTTRPRTKLVWE
jgi:hypothetical protein